MIYEQFIKQASLHPDAIAVATRDSKINYADLDKRVRNIVLSLQHYGIESGDVVALYHSRDIELLASILAILKIGAIYLPIDIKYPFERAEKLLERSNAKLILTDTDKETDNKFSCPQLITSSIQKNTENKSEIVCSNSPDKIAYILFTSGSTGVPKGVCIRQKSTLALLDWATDFYSDGELKCILAGTSVCFDLSIFELLLPLVTGNTVYLVENILELIDNPPNIEITLLNTVPSAIDELINLSAIPQTVKTINLAGEPLRQSTVDRLYELSHVEKVYNLYGPTEDTTYSTCYRAEYKATNPMVPIGRAIKGTRALVLDSNKKLVPLEVKGELYLAGPGLSVGYLNDKDRTDEKFFEIELPQLGLTRAYMTGDIVCKRKNGDIDFIGRVDDQIKVRGFRIEPGEIESEFLKIESVEQAIVVAKKNGQQNNLIAFVMTADHSMTSNAIVDALQKKLPSHMIPNEYHFVEEFPLNQNGKVDRKVLRDRAGKLAILPEKVPEHSEGSETEKKLIKIWQELLQCSNINSNDNFFALGGYSLLATKLLFNINRFWQIDLSLRDVFDSNTLSDLAQLIEKKSQGGQSLKTPVRAIPSNNPKQAPLSNSQRSLWFVDKILPDKSIYNLPLILKLNGPLDTDALKQAVYATFKKHNVLKISVQLENDIPNQILNDSESQFHFEIDTWSAEKGSLQNIIDQYSLIPFDLTHDCLFTVKLLQINKRESILILRSHHFVVDGQSLIIIASDISRYYNANLRKEPIVEKRYRAQYLDYSLLQHESDIISQSEKSLAYWKGHLNNGSYYLNLPFDYKRPVSPSYSGRTHVVTLENKKLDELKALCLKNHVTLSTFLLALYYILLYRFSTEEDIIVGVPFANRIYENSDEVVGNFVNTLPLRQSMDGELTFESILSKTKDIILQAFDHQFVPFEKIVESTQVARTQGVHPIYQVAFVMQDDYEQAFDLEGVLVEQQKINYPYSKFDLTLSILEKQSDLELSFEFSTELFAEKSIQQLADIYLYLLDGVLADKKISIKNLPLLPENAMPNNYYGVKPNKPSAEPAKTLIDYFETHTASYPDAIAVRHGDVKITYHALNQKAHILANALKRKGLKDRELVGICMERSVDLIVAILACYKLACAYVALDPDYPTSRLQLMVDDSKISNVVTDRASAKTLNLTGVNLYQIHELHEQYKDLHSHELYVSRSPNDLAYIIYTSGSTGKPKGVMIPQKNVVRLFTTTEKHFDFDREDIWCLFHSYAFDFSIWEIWGALFYGGTLVIVDYLASRDPKRFSQLLYDEKVTVLNQTPSAFKQLIAEDNKNEKKNLSLRYVIFGGESLNPTSLQPWVERYGLEQPQLINMYGITETTVHISYHRITQKNLQSLISLIGEPLPDSQLILMDLEGQPVPKGWVGELYVATPGLALGYLNREALSNERFLDNKNFPNSRLYRTGDLARMNFDNQLEYLGRIDHQVQLRGFRIELDEIEAVIKQYNGVKDTIVLIDQSGSNHQMIAFYVGTDDMSGGLRQFLNEQLPHYMVPNFITAINEIPLTVNNKVDTKELLKLPRGAGTVNETSQKTRTTMETVIESIWLEVLGLKTVDIDTVFFDVGGHSLLLVQVHDELCKKIAELPNVKAPRVVDLFKYPTIKTLAAYMSLTPETLTLHSSTSAADARAAKRRHRKRKNS